MKLSFMNNIFLVYKKNTELFYDDKFLQINIKEHNEVDTCAENVSASL